MSHRHLLSVSKLFLPELILFIKVFQAGSFSKAADKHGYQQPYLTKAISRLEEHLGSSVFIRSRSGVRATELGKLLLEFSNKVEQIQLDDEVRSDVHHPRVLRIGCHPSVAMTIFPKVIPILQNKFPRTELKLMFQTSLETTDKVLAGECDVGFVVNHLRNRQLLFRNLSQEDVFCFINKKVKADRVLATDKITLMHPDMIQFSKIEKLMRRSLLVGDYEVIGKMTSQNEQYLAILPQSVGSRYQLVAVNKALFTVKLSVVLHESAYSKVFTKELLDAFL